MPQDWSDLPNAVLIDRILADLRARPEVWTAAAWDAASDAAWYAAWDAAWSAARAAARGAAGSAAWDAARAAARAAARDAARACGSRPALVDAASAAAWPAAGAILALIAWDDCAHLLDTDPDQVQVLALLGQPAAVLLYPACRALHKSSIKSMTYST